MTSAYAKHWLCLAALFIFLLLLVVAVAVLDTSSKGLS